MDRMGTTISAIMKIAPKAKILRKASVTVDKAELSSATRAHTRVARNRTLEILG
jgi:hypothetical protein